MIEEYGHKKQEIKRIRANILGEQGRSYGRRRKREDGEIISCTIFILIPDTLSSLSKLLNSINSSLNYMYFFYIIKQYFYKKKY